MLLIVLVQAGVDTWNGGHWCADTADSLFWFLDITARAESVWGRAFWGHWRGSCWSPGLRSHTSSYPLLAISAAQALRRKDRRKNTSVLV